MNILNRVFNKLYCINLKERTDRWSAVSHEFHKYTLVVERIDAINGKRLNSNEYPLKHGNFAGSIAGQLGCLLSHKKIIEKATEEKLESIVIFEDDIIFSDKFEEKLEANIKYLPDDWHIFYLGGNHIFKKEFDPVLPTWPKANKDNYFNLNGIYKTSWTQTTHAYAINYRAYIQILKRLANINNPIDLIYVDMQAQGILNFYAFLPSLMWQNDSFSNILNKKRGRFIK